MRDQVPEHPTSTRRIAMDEAHGAEHECLPGILATEAAPASPPLPVPLPTSISPKTPPAENSSVEEPPPRRSTPRQTTNTPEPAMAEPNGQRHDRDGSPELDKAVGAGPPFQRATIEVLLPEKPAATRDDYVVVHSNVVDHVISEELLEDELWYKIEFTDGREVTVAFTELLALPNGPAALTQHLGDPAPSSIMGKSRGRRRPRERAALAELAESDDYVSDFDNDTGDLSDEPDEDFRPKKQGRAGTRTLRSAVNGPARHASAAASNAHDGAEDDDDESVGEQPAFNSRRRRRLRQRQSLLSLTSLSLSKRADQEDDRDELSLDHPEASDHEADSDPDVAFVVSDIVKAPAKGTRRLRSRRPRAKTATAGARSVVSQGSDIEFEAPRRSGRATRNMKNMEDLAPMDLDSFYVADDRQAVEARTVSLKEVFQTLSADSEFSEVHMPICDACRGGPSPNKGSLIGCQGCSISYHKPCLGPRQTRDHLVTKIGPEEFVLQCRYCINKNKASKNLAPDQAMCQVCRETGRSCRPMSKRKTTKQEERLRLENGGEDPSETVDGELINNADNVLFRCLRCRRPWHIEHLPSTRTAVSDVTSLRQARLEDYTVDWKCNECAAAKTDVHHLVAWRHRDKDKYLTGQTYSDLDDDSKEYLIKWMNRSYFRCKWMPGAWVFGFVTGPMRSAYAKKVDYLQPYPIWDEKDAFPANYLLADIIMSASTEGGSQGKSLEAEMARINKVSKIYVKFQGLGYDDIVWDTPPPPDSGPAYDAFKAAYREYLVGMHFENEPAATVRKRVEAWKTRDFCRLVEQPLGLKPGMRLMDYQLQGVNWLLSKFWQGHNAVLADEMGLGKTIQIVSLITALVQEEPKCWPFLVVVPGGTAENWRREFQQWSPDLHIVSYHGGQQAQEMAYKFELFPDGNTDMKAHVVVMSYESAQMPETKTKFKHVRWAGLVVDEGQRLKNDENLLYGALLEMKIPFRILLTGTPLQNNKRELFNLIQFIDEKQNAVKLDEQYMFIDKHNIRTLHELINPYFMRRTKAQVLGFLPPMAQVIVPVSMTVLQERLCKSIIAKNPDLIQALFTSAAVKVKDKSTLNNILIQLRKCLAHPFMYSDAVEEAHEDPAVVFRNLIGASGKLLLLEQMLPKLKERGHRVLIFSQFLQQLDIIEDFLTGLDYEYRRLDGNTHRLDKQKNIDYFNAEGSACFAFLLSTRAGGVGINLATADTVIILDPDFNPHQDLQALSRAHRIGQKNKVLCIQLMTKDSVEEKIIQSGRKKMALDHVLIENMDQEHANVEDLESILKSSAEALWGDDDKKEVIRYDAAAIDKLLDRSDMEATQLGGDKTHESQFAHTRIWSNEKGTFDSEMREEPVQVDASVWEAILAEREAEARRAAQIKQEILGRGGRRRQAINYKTNMLEDGIPDGDSSAEDGDFAQPDSGDDEDDEDVDMEEAVDSDIAQAAESTNGAATQQRARGMAQSSEQPHAGNQDAQGDNQQGQPQQGQGKQPRPRDDGSPDGSAEKPKKRRRAEKTAAAENSSLPKANAQAVVGPGAAAQFAGSFNGNVGHSFGPYPAPLAAFTFPDSSTTDGHVVFLCDVPGPYTQYAEYSGYSWTGRAPGSRVIFLSFRDVLYRHDHKVKTSKSKHWRGLSNKKQLRISDGIPTFELATASHADVCGPAFPLRRELKAGSPTKDGGRFMILFTVGRWPPLVIRPAADGRFGPPQPISNAELEHLGFEVDDSCQELKERTNLEKAMLGITTPQFHYYPALVKENILDLGRWLHASWENHWVFGLARLEDRLASRVVELEESRQGGTGGHGSACATGAGGSIPNAAGGQPGVSPRGSNHHASGQPPNSKATAAGSHDDNAAGTGGGHSDNEVARNTANAGADDSAEVTNAAFIRGALNDMIGPLTAAGGFTMASPGPDGGYIYAFATPMPNDFLLLTKQGSHEIIGWSDTRPDKASGPKISTSDEASKLSNTARSSSRPMQGVPEPTMARMAPATSMSGPPVMPPPPVCALCGGEHSVYYCPNATEKGVRILLDKIRGERHKSPGIMMAGQLERMLSHLQRKGRDGGQSASDGARPGASGSSGGANGALQG